MKRRIPVGRSVAGALVALLVSAGAGSVPARAEVKLGAPFSDGAVLQRGQPVRVWGTAVAGEKVSVSFGGRSAVATADASGAWRTELPAFEASKEPRTLVARAVSGEAKAFECMDWAAWQALGKDRGSLVADPLFADPGKGDFTLRDGSLALKTGFVPWDVGKAGLYDDRRYWGSGADYWLRLFRGGGSPH